MKFNLIKNKYELNKHFEIRKKIIEFYNPKNNQDFIYINNLSHIYINMKFLNCKYNSKIEKIVNNLTEKVNKNKIKIKNSNKVNNKINTKVKNINKNINNSKNIKLKTNTHFNTLKVAELKNLLKKKKLSVSGKKSELIQRLKANSH